MFTTAQSTLRKMQLLYSSAVATALCEPDWKLTSTNDHEFVASNYCFDGWVTFLDVAEKMKREDKNFGHFW